MHKCDLPGECKAGGGEVLNYLYESVSPTAESLSSVKLAGVEVASAGTDSFRLSTNGYGKSASIVGTPPGRLVIASGSRPKAGQIGPVGGVDLSTTNP